MFFVRLIDLNSEESNIEYMDEEEQTSGNLKADPWLKVTKTKLREAICWNSHSLLQESFEVPILELSYGGDDWKSQSP